MSVPYIKSEGALCRRGMSPWTLPLPQLLSAWPREGVSCSASHQTVGSALLPKCLGKKCRVPVCSTLYSDGAHCLCSSFRLLCHSWNPNLNNPGMVRLPKCGASKTGSILCTYPVVLLKMLLGGWNPDTVDVEKEGFFSLLSGFWGGCSIIYYLF